MKIDTLLRRQTGLNLTPAQVERAVTQRMRARGILARDAYMQAMSPDELDELAELVVVPESWMFRDADSFRAAVQFVRNRLETRPRSTVRILSMPCAGGEEPYSMGMALFDAGVVPDAYRIDAIDLSREAIAVARKARYTQNAFRGSDLGFRERYFQHDGERYQLSDRVRAQVDFRQGNLLTLDVSAAAGTYSVIFCRNLLIYFDEPTVEKAVGQLRTLLADDGMLLAGHAELPWFCRYGFTSSRDDGAFVLRKEQADALRIPRPAVPLRASPPLLARKREVPKPVQAIARARPTSVAKPQAAATAPLLDTTTLLALASRCADAGQLDQALQHCEAALAIQGDLPEAFYVMGLVSAARGQPAAAFDQWRRCLYLEPNHYEALCHLALLAFDQGDTKGADAYRQRAARVFAKRAEQGDAG